VALPHLAARRAYRSPDRRLDDPGGRAAETGRVWLPAPDPAVVSGEGNIFAGALAFLATAAIVFGAFGSYAQTDFKRLVAYSSVNHMGFVVLGIAAAAAYGADRDVPTRPLP
jgi:hypothetical protein